MNFIRIEKFTARRFRTIKLPTAYRVILSESEKGLLWFDVNLVVHRPLVLDAYGEGDEYGRALIIQKSKWVTSDYRSGCSFIVDDNKFVSKEKENAVLKTIKYLRTQRHRDKEWMELCIKIPLQLNDEIEGE